MVNVLSDTKTTVEQDVSKLVAKDNMKPLAQTITKTQDVSDKVAIEQNSSTQPNSKAEKTQLPNTGSENNQATVAAGLALLGLGVGLASVKNKKED